MASIPPALLADATWYGTLAAVRDLGSRSVPIALASDVLLAPARWSRHTSRCVACPPMREPGRFLEWLLAFGEREPGHVLYPTSDDSAWLISAHRQALSRRFRLFSPPIEALARLLDKARLAVDARAAGLDAPETRCPEDELAVERAGREMSFPILLKPRTQVMLEDWSGRRKGFRVDRPQDLLAGWRASRGSLRYDPEIGGRLVGLDRPVLQECHPASERVYTVDGFVDESGELYAALACNKVLQHPRGSGPGVIFEDAPLDPAIATGLRRLCRSAGFFGVFDAEFLVEGDRRLLIDFNPRFYNHMAFEVDRGLPLPWLAYLAAVGDRDALRRSVAEAQAAPRAGRVYVHRLPTSLLLAVQVLTGAMSAEERRGLRGLVAAHQGRITDPVVGPGDRCPALMEAAMLLASFARHPRSFLRQLAAGAAVAPARPDPGARARVAAVQARPAPASPDGGTGDAPLA